MYDKAQGHSEEFESMITIRRQIGVETIFLLAMGAAVGIFFITYKNNYQPHAPIALTVPVVPVVPVATEAPVSKVAISSQISPDGAKKVIMRVKRNPDNTSTYDFSTADENNGNESHIMTKILDPSKTISIPFNAWSPDDKYFFIQEKSGTNNNVFVFKATGAPFSEGEIFLDLTDLFTKANTGNNFSEATGWASDSLIVVNTTKQDNTKGFSYWFEVPTHAIIQLSTEF